MLLLVVQEDKQHLELEPGDPKPQLIAEAIAAFQSNNACHQDILGLPVLETKVIAGIMMTSTFPTFFKIPVTAKLIEADVLSLYPATPTVVHMHIPDIPQ
jgi:hypothetical protein